MLRDVFEQPARSAGGTAHADGVAGTEPGGVEV